MHEPDRSTQGEELSAGYTRNSVPSGYSFHALPRSVMYIHVETVPVLLLVNLYCFSAHLHVNSETASSSSCLTYVHKFMDVAGVKYSDGS